MVAGIGLLVYEQKLFLMPAFHGQLVPIVQACHVRLENYEVFLLFYFCYVCLTLFCRQVWLS